MAAVYVGTGAILSLVSIGAYNFSVETANLTHQIFFRLRSFSSQHQ